MDLKTDLCELPLVQGAAEAKRPTRWWLVAMMIPVVFIIVIGGAVNVAYSALIPYESGSLAAQGMEFFTNGAAVLGLWLWLRYKEQRPFSSLGFRGGRMLPKFGIGLAIGAGMSTLTVAILLLTGQYQMVPAPPNAVGGVAALLPVILLVIVWTMQSSTEEILMRGYLLPTSALQLPGWFAILIGGLLFSGLHFVEGFLPIAGVNIILFSTLASFVALRQGALWMVCGIHTAWNWFLGNVFNVPVSGNPYATGILHFRPVENSPQWLSGGSFGPENSIVVTLIWGIAAIAAYRYFRSRRELSDSMVRSST